MSITSASFVFVYSCVSNRVNRDSSPVVMETLELVKICNIMYKRPFYLLTSFNYLCILKMSYLILISYLMSLSAIS